MGALNLLRIKMVEKCESAFDIGNMMFLIAAVVNLVVVEMITMILLRVKKPDVKAKFYKFLTFMDIFFAFVNPFLMLMVLEDFQKHGWIGQFVLNAIIGVVVAYCSYGDENLSKNSFAVCATYMGLFLVPMMLSLVLFVTNIQSWIVYSVLYMYILTEVTNIGIAFLNCITEELEDCQLHKNESDMEQKQFILQLKTINHP